MPSSETRLVCHFPLVRRALEARSANGRAPAWRHAGGPWVVHHRVVHLWLRPNEQTGALIMGFASLSLVLKGLVLRMLSKARWVSATPDQPGPIRLRANRLSFSEGAVIPGSLWLAVSHEMPKETKPKVSPQKTSRSSFVKK